MPISAIAIVVGISCSSPRSSSRIRFRHRAGQRQPEADPRQHAARDRLDDRPGADPRRVAVPTVTTIFDLAESPAARARSRSPSSASSGGGSSSYPDSGEGRHRRRARTSPIEPRGATCTLDARATTRSRRRLQRHPLLLGAGARRQEGRRARPRQHLTLEADKPGTYLGQCAEYCGLSHANMRFRVIAQSHGRLRGVARRAAAGHGPHVDVRRHSTRRGRGQDLFTNNVRAARTATRFDDSAIAELRPEPHAPREPHDVRERHVQAEPREPRRVDPQRAGHDPDGVEGLPAATPGHTCVGMPSFTENTPKGQPTMTPPQAETIADYLLGQK